MGYNASDILALYGVEEPDTKKETTTADKILALYGVEKPATVQRQPKQTVTPSAPQSAAALSGTGNTDIQMPRLEINALGAGGWRRPEAKEKTAPTVEDIVAQKVEAAKAAEQLRYFETLNLEEQQKKIDALQSAVNTAPKYNVHAFGGYDPNGQSENETALAKAQEDYNLAKSVQYSVQGQALYLNFPYRFSVNIKII